MEDGERSGPALFNALRDWVLERGGGVDGGVELIETPCSRTLAASRPYEKGETLIELPFSAALGLRTALQALFAAEKEGEAGLVRGSLSEFLSFCETSNRVRHSTISLLVALQICHGAIHDESPLRRYTRLLPAPPRSEGSALSGSICGPLLIHPLLFEEELKELQSEDFRASLLRERELLRFIYENAINSEVLGFEDFVWAIAITRSRSLDLSLHLERGSQGQESLTCMLPIIDLCDHSGQASCSLRCHVTGDSVDSIELFAHRALCTGDALTIDYGHRGLRDFFRVYGFTPAEAECRAEVFEDSTFRPLESVLVSGERGGSFFSLRRVLLLSSLPSVVQPSRGDSVEGILDRALAEKSLLLDAEGCGCLYEVGDESPRSANFRGCPRVMVGGAVTEGLSCDGAGEEEAAVSRVLDYLAGLSRRMPTTLEEDRELLRSKLNPIMGAILRYRVARKALLRDLMDDLQGALQLLRCA